MLMFTSCRLKCRWQRVSFNSGKVAKAGSFSAVRHEIYRSREPFCHFHHRGNDFRKPRSISTIVGASRGNRKAFLRWWKRFAGTARHFHDGGNDFRKPRGISPIVGTICGNRTAFPRSSERLAGTAKCSHDRRNVARKPF